MGAWDWTVLIACMASMIAVGFYYGQRTESQREYLLGGGDMNPWAVGLSLFATLISTISYLAWPGEMIQHGPIMLTAFFAYPFVSLVVGWFLIPHFMGLKITSAYELLETRLGLAVRLTGSGIFLTLRLLWMAVIIYATAEKVVVPIMHLDRTLTCAALGFITVIYTSQGGLKAVVMTNVIQTFILFVGAIFTILLIAWRLGGFGAIMPEKWLDHWDPIVVFHDSDARVTMFAAALATFMWYVCTAGSDQMAIQRYLATRDARAARRMFNVSLMAEFLVTLLLAVLGLSLLAYARVHPEILGSESDLIRNADAIFPRFVASNLPLGFGGLVISAILAAAMSSLSSGLNSTCAVISADFIDRFEPVGQGQTPSTTVEKQRLRRTRNISWIIGTLVVGLSSTIGLVEGNLLELAYKIVNLLVAPLFGLFFMALFVRHATSFGTLIGVAVGVATVVAINYWRLFTGTQGISFLWAMPLGLTLQVVTGTLASLLPIGPRSKELTR